MKRKLSHVTNSSSVSFVGFGISFEGHNISDKLIENIKTLYENKYQKTIDVETIKEDPLDFVSSILPKEISMVYCEFSGSFIGGQYEDMPDDITKKQYHEQIKLKLEELGFDVSEIGFISESWRNG